MNNSEKMSKLLEKTNFEVMTDSRILTGRKRIRTPLETINCLLGGGFPLGIIAHLYGEPRSGKSTLLYQTMGNFQRDYPDGICVIVDMESSADSNRLTALGVDVEKVMRLPATSIENGFLALMQMIKNKESVPELKDVPIFVIWDTISKGLAQDGSTQSRMNAQDRARIIKNYMGELQKAIEKHDFFLGLINQIVYTTDRYGNRKITAGGGVALQHDNQISIFVKLKSDQFDEYNMLVRRDSEAQIDKSKISPEIKGLPYVMDVTKGAAIDEKASLLSYVYWMGLIDQGKGGWYNHRFMYNNPLSDELTKFIMDRLNIDLDKKHRWSDFEKSILEEDIFFDLFCHIYMNLIEDKFSLQKDVIKDYHLEKLENIRNKGIERGLFSNEEFEKYAFGVIPDSEDPLSEISEGEEETNLE